MFSSTSFISCHCKLSCFEEIHPKKFISVWKMDLCHRNIISFLPITGRQLSILDSRCVLLCVCMCNLEELYFPLKLVWMYRWVDIIWHWNKVNGSKQCVDGNRVLPKSCIDKLLYRFLCAASSLKYWKEEEHVNAAQLYSKLSVVYALCPFKPNNEHRTLLLSDR